MFSQHQNDFQQKPTYKLEFATCGCYETVPAETRSLYSLRDYHKYSIFTYFCNQAQQEELPGFTTFSWSSILLFNLTVSYLWAVASYSNCLRSRFHEANLAWKAISCALMLLLKLSSSSNRHEHVLLLHFLIVQNVYSLLVDAAIKKLELLLF